MKNKQWKRYIAGFMACTMLFLQGGNLAYATDISDNSKEITENANAPKEQDSADAPKKQENADAPKEQESANAPKKQEDANAPKKQESADAPKKQENADVSKEKQQTKEESCTCADWNWDCSKLPRCPLCDVCKSKPDVCEYHAPACICKESNWNCNGNNGKNPDCEACKLYSTYCEWEPPVCTCAEDDFICNENHVNENCPVCMENWGKCKYQCLCMLFRDEVCTKENHEETCEVCKRRPERCYVTLSTAKQINEQLNKLPGRPVYFLSEQIVPLEETLEITSNITFEITPIMDMGGKAFLQRDMTMLDKPLFVVKSGATLTLDRIELSGESNYTTASAPLIMVEQGGRLILRGGSTVYKNENQAGQGGGIYCSGGTVIMEDTSSVYDNEAATGAGIYLDENSSLILSGDAAVTSNKASTLGGGIYAAKGAKIQLAERAQIYGNKAAGDLDNLYLSKNAEKINLDGGLKDGAKISLTMEENGKFATKNTKIKNEDIRAFKSDKDFYISAGDKFLELREEQGVKMTGKVTLDGLAVQNALVILVDKKNGEEIGRSYTDKDGVYRMTEQIEETECRALVSVTIEEQSYAACKDFNILPDKSKSINPDIELQKGYCISGKISGENVAEVQITAWTENGSKIKSTKSYGGRYDMLVNEDTFSIMAEGTKEGISYSAGWYADKTVREGILTADMKMREGKIATGYLKDAEGNPLQGAAVTFYASPGKSKAKLSSIPSAEEPIETAVTDVKGFYRIPSTVFKTAKIYQAVIFDNKMQKAACEYVLTGFKEDGWQPEQVYNLITENYISVAEETLSLEGVVKGVPYVLGFEGDKILANYYLPEDIKLVLLQKNGVKAAEAKIDNETGKFELKGILPGDYIASLVSVNNPEIAICMERAAFQIDENGTVEIDDESEIIGINKDAKGLELNVKGTWKFQNCHQQAERNIKEYTTENEEWINDPEHFWYVSSVNQYLTKELNLFERQMFPKELRDKVNAWLDYLASKYKVKVKVKNEKQDLLQSIDTSLGLGDKTTDSAKRIVAVALEGQDKKQDIDKEEDVNLILSTKEAANYGKQAINEAMSGGEILGYFDMDLQADYKLKNKQDKTTQITETAEAIEISVGLEQDLLEKDGEYVVLRSHESDDKMRVDRLPAVFKDGKLTFETDSFSTYAIAYAKPGKGIIVKPSEKPEPPKDDDDEDDGSSDNDNPGGGGSSDDDNKKPDNNKPNNNKPGTSDNEKPNSNKPNNNKPGTSDNAKPNNNKPGTANNAKPNNNKPGKVNQMVFSGKEGKTKTSKQKVTRITAPKKYEGDSYDNQYLFWRGVQEKIAKAEENEIIEVENGDYDLIPAQVIQELEGRNVTLILNYQGKEQIILEGKNIVRQEGVTYYTYEMLKEMMKSSKAEQKLSKEEKMPKTDKVKKEKTQEILKEVENRGKNIRQQKSRLA